MPTARCTSTGRRWTGGARPAWWRCVHVDDYEQDIIRKHEKTRKDKEDDRTRHVLTLNANAEPVFLAYRDECRDRRATWRRRSTAPALYDFIAPDGVRHIVWRVADPGAAACAHFARGAAGLRGRRAPPLGQRLARGPGAAARRTRTTPATRSTTGSSRCCSRRTSCAILPYNRVVQDLNGLTPEAFRDRLAPLGRLERGDGLRGRRARGRSRSSSRARW